MTVTVRSMMRIELDFIVPATAVHAACEAAGALAGGCTVDGTARHGEWPAPDGTCCVEPVRVVTVGIPVLMLGTVVRGMAASLGRAGERALYVRHAGTGLAYVLECPKD